MSIKWNPPTLETFNKVINNLPQFHRNIAKQLVKEKAEQLCTERNSEVVEDEDLIIAFFQEIPPAFKGMMKRLFHHLNINYNKFVKEADSK